MDVKKSEFIVQETKFLRVIIRADSLRIDPEKIAAIINGNILTNIKQVLLFLGFYNFYRRFIRDFIKIANPITALTRKDRV